MLFRPTTSWPRVTVLSTHTGTHTHTHTYTHTYTHIHPHTHTHTHTHPHTMASEQSSAASPLSPYCIIFFCIAPFGINYPRLETMLMELYATKMKCNVLFSLYFCSFTFQELCTPFSHQKLDKINI